jgi:hypothetical protein
MRVYGQVQWPIDTFDPSVSHLVSVLAVHLSCSSVVLIAQRAVGYFPPESVCQIVSKNSNIRITSV